jgi:transposase-like protein
MRVAPEIILTNEERVELMKLVRSRLTSVRLEQRAGIVLLAADGFQNMDIAEMLGLGRVQVSRWRQRYSLSRLAGIERDLPRGAPSVTVDIAIANQNAAKRLDVDSSQERECEDARFPQSHPTILPQISPQDGA